MNMDAQERFDAIIKALQCAHPNCACQRPKAHQAMMHCPVHDDQDPSLSVSLSNDKLLVCCQAGCAQDAVIDTLRTIGCWPKAAMPPTGLTLDQLAAAKKLPVAFLQSLGVRDHRDVRQNLPRVAIPYANEAGDLRAIHYRWALEKGGAVPRFTWRRDDKPLLYGLATLEEIHQDGWCLILEGDSDCWTAWFHGLPALGVPGTEMWKSEWAAALTASKRLPQDRIFVWCEDEAGLALVRKIAADLPNVRVLTPPHGVKDLSDLHIRGNDVVAVVEQLKREAKPVPEFLEAREREERERKAKEALGIAEGLLEDPGLLDRIDDVLRQRGLAGDTKGARLLYLAMTSRLLRRPVNVVIEGPSASGKNYTLSRVVGLFPPTAAYQLNASSERTLAYTDEDVRHRTIIVGESAGLHKDGIGATLMRSLIWDGRLVYEFVEKGTDDRLCVRRIEKDGPTNLITTTVRKIDEELATRLLTITVPDTPAQTRTAIRETARIVQTDPDEIDVAAFVALQTWLEAQGARRVIVPFAGALAELVDVGAVRVRRDFSQLIALVQTSALLHQRQRPSDGRGRVTATLADYGIVYSLVAESITAAVHGLTKAQREAVEAIVALYAETGKAVSRADVAKRLGIDPSAASRRLRPAIRAGYLVNDGAEHKPLELKPGADLPAPTVSIPEPAALEAAVGEARGKETPPQNDCTSAQVVENPDFTTVTAVQSARAVQNGDCTAAHPQGNGPVRPCSGPNGLHGGLHGPENEILQGSAGSPCSRAPDLREDSPSTPLPVSDISNLRPVVPNRGPSGSGHQVPAPCYACCHRRYWRFPSGRRRCQICHPAPAPRDVAWLLPIRGRWWWILAGKGRLRPADPARAVLSMRNAGSSVVIGQPSAGEVR